VQPASIVNVLLFHVHRPKVIVIFRLVRLTSIGFSNLKLATKTYDFNSVAKYHSYFNNEESG
jgi:hypothetical protein